MAVEQAAVASSSTASIPRLYVVQFPISHPTFRLPVLTSVAAQHGISLTFYPLPSSSQSCSYQDVLDSYDPDYSPEQDNLRPFCIVALESDEAARTLLKHCTVVRAIAQLWACSASPVQDDLFKALQEPSSIAQYRHYQPEEHSWKADVIISGGSMTEQEKIALIERADFLDFRGPVRMKNPSFKFSWWQERYPIITVAEAPKEPHEGQVRMTFAGRKISLPKEVMPARDWIDKLNLKKRSYIGNTSMEAEMALKMAQMAKAQPGKIVYDPFVGTGSMLIAAAAMGAYCIGSDIDGRMMRGKGAAKTDPKAKTGIMTAAKQYGLEHYFLDCITFDITQHPWRLAKEQHQAVPENNGSTSAAASSSSASSSSYPGFLDAIVADPPYGIRAGAKRLGQRDPKKKRTEALWLEDLGCWSHEQEDYVPPTRPYALKDLVTDLCAFAEKMLVDNGRLVFWLPCILEEEASQEATPVEKPTLPPNGVTSNGLSKGVAHGQQAPDEEEIESTEIPMGPAWELVAISVQPFGRWARKLVTLQRKSRQEEEASRRRKEDDELTLTASNLAIDPTTTKEKKAFTDSQTQFHAETGRYRADADDQDFRNRYFRGEGTRPK